MKKFLILLRKEMRELMTPIVIVPMLIIIPIFAVLGQSMSSITEEQKDLKMNIGVFDHDDTLTSFEVKPILEASGAQVTKLEGSFEDIDVNSEDFRDFKVFLEIPKGFEEDLFNLERPEIYTYTKLTHTSLIALQSQAQIDHMEAAITESYANKLIGTITPDHPQIIKQPLTTVGHVIANGTTAQVTFSRVMMFIQTQGALVPIVFILIIMLGAQMVAVTIATEKEDKTLEILLSSPVNRKSIIVAKICAAAVIALLFSAIYLIGYKLFMGSFTEGLQGSGQAASAFQELGITFGSLDFILIGLSLLAATICALIVAIILGILAEDVKSVQMVMAPLYIVVLIPYMLTTFVSLDSLPMFIQAFILSLPFSYPFIGLEKLIFGQEAFMIYGFIYQAFVVILLIFFAAKIFSSDTILTFRFNFLKKYSAKQKKRILVGVVVLVALLAEIPLFMHLLSPEEKSGTDTVQEIDYDGDIAELLIGNFEGSAVIFPHTQNFEIVFERDNKKITGLIKSDNEKIASQEPFYVTLKGNSIQFEVKEHDAHFDGTFVSKTNIRGTFTQQGIEGFFDLERSNPTTLPYTQEEVRIQNGDITLAGTLSTPEGPGPFPAVVLLTGSGTQDRDENIFGFKVFKKIADHLTRKGIAVLRYDDRHAGDTTGGDPKEETTKDFATDAVAAIDFLKTKSNIDPKQIGLLGHSEGSMIAYIAATLTNDIAFSVLMAGPVIPARDINLWQIEHALQKIGVEDHLFEKAVKMQKALVAHVLEGTPIPEEHQKLLSKRDLKVMTHPWFVFFANFEPEVYLRDIRFPILALFGGKDMQVPASSNAALLEQILSEENHPDYTIKTFKNANHLFQEADTGEVEEYPTLPKAFTPGFLDTVGDWILDQSR